MKRSEQNRWDESPIDAQLAAPPVSYDERPSEYQAADVGVTATPFGDMMQNRGAVLAVLFLATGALGLPLLWMNKKFSDRERMFWAIVVTIYTVILIAAVGWVCLWSYRRVVGY
jgi:hypothetical protein